MLGPRAPPRYPKGTVNLLGLPGAHEHGWIGRVDFRCGRLGGCCRARDLVPGGEPAGHFAAVLLGAESVTAGPEVR
jgi:hypothetical protein